MKNAALSIVIATVFLGSCQPENAQEPLQLWYDQPAANWQEALPLGNGLTGAMVFGGISTEQFMLNDNTLWSGGPNPGNRENGPEVLSKVRQAVFDGNYAEADKLWRGMHGPYSSRYLAMGDLFLDFPFSDDAAANYHRSLDLRKATSTVSFTIDGVNYNRESFISYPDQVLAVKLTSNGKGNITFDASLTSKLNYNVKAISSDYLVLKGKAPSYVAHRNHEPEQIIYEPDGEGMTFEIHLRLIPTGGQVTAQNGTIGVKDADEVVLLVSAATSFNGFDRSPAFEGTDPAPIARGKLDAASELSYNELLERHLADYRKYFDRVELHLGPQQMDYPTDDRLLRVNDGHQDNGLTALYFQYGRYLMIASARKGTPPSNLQGIWNPFVQPPWGSNYTININTQMNYWPAEITNLAEFHHSLFDFMEGLAVNGAVTAKTNYGISSGWLAHHNTDIWAKTSPTGGEDWDHMGTPRWTGWPMGGVWFTQHLWEHFLHNGDKEFLEQKAWPLMKGSAEFLLHWLVEDENGYLVTNPSTSPENSFGLDGQQIAISMASTMDMSLIRESFSNMLQAAALLGISDSLTERIEKAIPRLYPFHIGRLGQLQEWYRDWDDPNDTHRHISHLFSLFPGNQITPRYTPELASAAMQTLDHRGDISTGWSMAWKLSWWARLKDGNKAYQLFKSGLTYVGRKVEGGSRDGTGANLFGSAHGHVQLDGNYGGAAGIAELLVQSHEGYIHLLPALPDDLAAGEVKGLVVRGGFVIDMKWDNGQLESAVIHSRLGGKCRIKVKGTLTSRDVRLKPAEGENPNPLLSKPDIAPFLNNALSELPELNPGSGNRYDFQTVAGRSYRLRMTN
ncbi:MAG: glycoside hydrolase family 95 protein [Balneolaceae bacterium]|nr:MAG: glycoside hydrolase family 95 protein [Balneolaceae bacterium]